MLYVGLDLSRKRVDFDALFAGGERCQRGEDGDPLQWLPRFERM
jgi:hypothetical protein